MKTKGKLIVTLSESEALALEEVLSTVKDVDGETLTASEAATFAKHAKFAHDLWALL